MKQLRFALLFSTMLVFFVCSVTSFYVDDGYKTEQSSAVKPADKAVLTEDFVVEAPLVGLITLISRNDRIDGHTPSVDPRCNGPTS